MIEAWSLFHAAKPFTLNDRLHYQERRRINEEWVGAFAMLARIHRVPKGLDHIVIWARQHYTQKRYEPDPDNQAVSVKAAIDGLRSAGVIQDDRGQWIGPVVLDLPVLGKQQGLELLIVAEPAWDWPATNSGGNP